MKIGILTQPLHSNYGGLLQAWALQRTVIAMDHEATIINRFPKSKVPFWIKYAWRIMNDTIISLKNGKKYRHVTEELRNYSEQNVRQFKNHRYLGISPALKSNEELKKYISNEKFEAYIVGSDQVWRPIYSPDLMTYFLDFTKDNNNVRKIAYAASFGVNNWEFSEQQTKQASELLPLFDVVSVREASGVDLVRDYLKCNATHVLDPTLLIDKNEYTHLIENSTCSLHNSDGELFCYILDKSQVINNLIKSCSSITGYKAYYCNPITPLSQLQIDESIDNCIVPPVEQWLKSFEDAKIVITDSFHGVLFSIIFNKPFWIIINDNRGAARFSSILNQFNLEERIINDPSQIDWFKPIDWERINKIKSQLVEKSKNFLSSNLIT